MPPTSAFRTGSTSVDGVWMPTRIVPPGAPAAAVAAAELVARRLRRRGDAARLRRLLRTPAAEEDGAAASDVAGADAADELVSSPESPHAASSNPIMGTLMPATDARRTNSRRLMRPAM